MHLNRIFLLAAIPVALAACDSQQPTYTASNPQPVAAAPAPAAPAPAPVAQTPPPAAPTAMPSAPEKPAAAVAPGGIKHPDRHPKELPKPKEVVAQVDPIGVGNCDDFVKRFRTCINSGIIRGGQKFGMSRVFRQEVQQWQLDVKAGKSSDVAQACSAADKDARERFSKLGCTSF